MRSKRQPCNSLQMVSHTKSRKDVHQKVILIDGDRLADLMIEHNIGVAPFHSYEIKPIDSDYFDQD